MSLPDLSQFFRQFSRPPVTRAAAGQAADDPTRPQGPVSPTLDIDANDAEASAAAQSQRLFGPVPGMDRPLRSWEAAANYPDALPRDARMEAMYARLADIVRSPSYEFYGPYPCGGPSGTYSIYSPLSTPSEWQLVAVTFQAAGTAIVSSTANQPAPSATSVYNAATNGGIMPTLVGYPTAAAAATTQVLGTNWTPIDPNGSVFVTTLLGSGAAWAMIAFRRLLTVDALPAQTIYG